MEIGRHTVTIVTTDIITVSEKPVASILVRFEDGEESESYIWLTEAAMGMARAQLKVCGFDPDKDNFGDLVDKPEMLAGRKIDIIVEDYKGRMQVKIPTRTTPPRTVIDSIGKVLKAVKGSSKATVDPATDVSDIPF